MVDILLARPRLTLLAQATQVSAVQGLGKEIAPREETNTPAKRDLAGFDRALRFAEVGLSKGPRVQLGTGAEGSGVGIIVDNRAGVVGAEAEHAGGAPAEKRDVEAPSQPLRARVTTMYIRNGLPEGESLIRLPQQQPIYRERTSLADSTLESAPASQ